MTQEKWTVNLVIADGHFLIFDLLICKGMYELTYSLYHPRGYL